jgi:hypothetical protein
MKDKDKLLKTDEGIANMTTKVTEVEWKGMQLSLAHYQYLGQRI